MRRSAPLTAIAAALGFWSVLGYLTVPLSGDLLAEGIQVRRLLDDPSLVLAYPGQNFGGVLEYPVLMIGELIDPGNPYLFILPRLLVVPLAGVFTCCIFRRLFPGFTLSYLVVAACVAPAVLHGPMIINALYPMSWMLALGGCALLLREIDGGAERRLALTAAGVLMGLGVYEHPSVAMLLAPMLTLTLLSRLGSITRRPVIAVSGGMLLGVLPLAVSLLRGPTGPLVWDPVGLHLPDVVGLFGFDTATDGWRTAVLPNGWGTVNGPLAAHGSSVRARLVMSAPVAIGLAALIVRGVRDALRHRGFVALPPFAMLAAAWVAALVSMLALTVVVVPAWFYGTALGFLVWMTVGALPQALPKRVGVGVFVAAILAAGVTSVYTSRDAILDIDHFLTDNRENVSRGRETAQALERAGAEVVYGDYWQVVPLAYYSGGGLSPVSTTFSRFYVPAAAADDGSIITAVDVVSTASESIAAAQQVRTRCAVVDAHVPSTTFGLFACPAAMFETGDLP